MALNKQLNRVGPLYQSRYRCIFVDKEGYLLQLARYIHLNPVVAKLAQLPDAWPYSNYTDIIGKRQGILKDTSLVPERFRTCTEYQDFVESYLTELKRVENLEKTFRF
jgi:hypothetical protein